MQLHIMFNLTVIKVFIDTLSFEKIINENYTWLPYKQFCEMFLGPLSLMSYVNPDLIN